MFHLGFIVSESTVRTPFAEAEVGERENKLLIKIWSHLKGKYKGYVSLDNIKVYLSAILNLELSFMFDKGHTLKQSTQQEKEEKRDFSRSDLRFASAREERSVSKTKGKKTGFKNVGVFTTKGRFLFKNSVEIKKIHGYYKMLSSQRNKYSSQFQKAMPRSSSRSKTKILYTNFNKENEEHSLESSGYFGKSFYDESKKRS